MERTKLKERVVEGKSGEIILDTMIESGQEKVTVIVQEDVEKLVVKNCEGYLYVRPSLKNLQEVHLRNCQLKIANILVPGTLQASRCTINDLLHVDMTEDWDEMKRGPRYRPRPESHKPRFLSEE